MELDYFNLPTFFLEKSSCFGLSSQKINREYAFSIFIWEKIQWSYVSMSYFEYLQHKSWKLQCLSFVVN